MHIYIPGGLYQTIIQTRAFGGEAERGTKYHILGIKSDQFVYVT